MRDFTPEELATVERMAADGKSKTETGRLLTIAFSNFSANVNALGIKFQKTGMDHAKRVFTPDELRMVKKLAEAGFGKTEVYERLTIGHDSFKRLCAEHGIVFEVKHNPPPPVTNKRHISDEDAAIFRSMAERGATRHQLAARFGVSISTVGRFFRDLGIPAQKIKRAPEAVKSKAKGKRNAMNHLMEWKPPAATTDIEIAVQTLRQRYPVFAETTLRYPSRPPQKYGMETRFRVGSERDVPAARVLEMAGAVA
jgi:transposase